MLGEPGQPSLRGRQRAHRKPEALAVQAAAQHQGVRTGADAELLGDVGGDAVVRGRRGGQHRHALGQVAQQRAQPPVVRPEVVAPVGDAVCLVDDQQPGRRGQLRQDAVAEVGVVQPFRADQQHVHLTGRDGRLHLVPFLRVGGVHRRRVDPGARRRRDLVAHQGEQRRDDHRRPLALLAQQRRGQEVDRRLAPAGALHDQRTTPLGDQRLDRRPLVFAQLRRLAGQRPEEGFGTVAQRCGGVHALTSTPSHRQVTNRRCPDRTVGYGM